jgi:GTPase Era involved in 16S rRNA processing
MMQEMGADVVYNKLMQRLLDCKSKLRDEYHLNLDGINLSIDRAIEKMSKPIEVAIIGKISSSKSTLVNALLGEAEMVRTGQMEETFNVSWIKYGDSDADIKVIFKDGTIQMVSRKDWGKWTSHKETNELKENVRYIEVTYRHDILKRINIIDTPGLDALSEIDSKNTIDFLKSVHPDAVVMLFTKSIAESTMSILNDFVSINKDSAFVLNPLNAIGVLAKVDTIWSVMNPGKDVLIEGKRIIDHTLYEKYPDVRHTLFDIFPLSALMGLAASTLTNEDVIILKKLVKVPSSTLCEMLSSPEFFFDDDYDVGVSCAERKGLCEKVGLYGLFVMIDYLRQNSLASRYELSQVLMKKSGFESFQRMIVSHFGDRANLIKAQNSLAEIKDSCQAERHRRDISVQELRVIDEIEKGLLSTLLSIHEYQEWNYLTRIYTGKEKADESIVKEFLTVCGERGTAAYEKLSMSSSSSIEEMKKKAVERALFWQGKYNIYSMANPTSASLIKVMQMSYNILIKELESIDAKMTEAKRVLNDCMLFVYGESVNADRL